MRLDLMTTARGGKKILLMSRRGFGAQIATICEVCERTVPSFIPTRLSCSANSGKKNHFDWAKKTPPGAKKDGWRLELKTRLKCRNFAQNVTCLGNPSENDMFVALLIPEKRKCPPYQESNNCETLDSLRVNRRRTDSKKAEDERCQRSGRGSRNS